MFNIFFLPLFFLSFDLNCNNSEPLPTPGSAQRVFISDEIELDKNIIEGWNAISSAYFQHKLLQTHPGELIEAPAFRQLLEKYAKSSKHVLDAATGNGWFTFSLLKWNILPDLIRIIGIDLSSAMIKTAQSQCSDSRAEFFCAPLESDIYEAIGINQKSLDLIISSNAFDCIRNIKPMLDRLYQLLKPGKCAIISIRHPLRNAYYLTGSIYGEFEEGAYAEHWDGSGNRDVIHFYRKESTWDKLFMESGFEIVEKVVPVISDTVAQDYPEHYQYYKNKKHPGALIYVLRKI